MILRDLNAVFIHCPKTAGQSIENAFLSRYQLTRNEGILLSMGPSGSTSILPPRLAHMQYDHYLKYKEILIGPVATDTFYFSFVRNPFSRIVSIYKHLTHSNSIKGFERFVLYDIQSKWTNTHRFFLASQYSFLKNTKQAGIDDLSHINFIGKFENLSTDMIKLCKLLNINPLKLTHSNKYKPQGFMASISHKLNPSGFALSEYFTKDSVFLRVLDLYGDDFKFLNYSSSL